MVASLCWAKIVELLNQFYKRYFMTLHLLLLFEKVTSNFDCFFTNFIIIEPIKLVARTVTDIQYLKYYSSKSQYSYQCSFRSNWGITIICWREHHHRCGIIRLFIFLIVFKVVSPQEVSWTIYSWVLQDGDTWQLAAVVGYDHGNGSSCTSSTVWLISRYPSTGLSGHIVLCEL